MWWFQSMVDAEVRRKLAKWEYERAREIGLFESGFLLRLHKMYVAEILRYAERPLLYARLFKED